MSLVGTLEGVQGRLDLGPERLTTPHIERADSSGDNGIEIKILGYTKLIHQWALMGELRKRPKDRFDKEGIEFPGLILRCTSITRQKQKLPIRSWSESILPFRVLPNG